ncbi:hypothetical protein E2P86_03685 [Sphingobacterium psychroaquaticum]|uniref:carbohydrate-binding family 9-like protein n=1 Tax=Sphingobacterium psychroaquaticum TaxID=561061 RepID=UPI00106B685D|nr:carbohydrate-binding family 9-like protein [Sphingobacterium psychroaquaticum]QBQ40296.1 hypothetical protein E2P86_03685 [Sphingobacterium psychroaquaticum]
MKRTTLLLSLFTIATPVAAQSNLQEYQRMQSPIKNYAVPKTTAPIHIDGKATEDAWEHAAWSDEFIDIEGHSKQRPAYQTKVKMLWDEDNLYVYALLEEPHVWGDLTKQDDIIYHNNDFEIFLKPYERHPFYYEIEVNALNTIMDLMMPKPYRLGGEAIMHWNVNQLQSAVHVEGSLNKPQDQDKYWAVEMAIPFRALQTYGKRSTPAINDFWRINFSRVQWQHEIKNGTYTRKKKDGKTIPEDNWVWSPIGIVNMHYPERWGYLHFVDKQTTEVSYPRSYHVEQEAWNIFYLQQLFKKEKKAFAHNLETLQKNFPKASLRNDSLQDLFFVDDAKSFYRVQIKDTNHHITATIDSNGNYTIHYEQ